MSDLVEFRHFKYILAVAETANFTRAAERLFLAQPSLSKQIKDLEDEIGFPITTAHTASKHAVISLTKAAIL
jgi:DNA-binding transcriptional LysR family regulator